MGHLIIQLLLNAVAVLAAAYFLSGIHVKSFGYAVVVALVLALLNTFVKPFFTFLSLPALVITLGLFWFVINAAIIQIASWLIGDGFRVDGWWWAIAFSLLLTVFNALFGWIVD